MGRKEEKNGREKIIILSNSNESDQLSKTKRKAAQQGDAEFQYDMGKYYSDWADRWVQYAADNGDDCRCGELAGELYAKAIACYKQAADQGHGAARDK